MSKIIGIIPCHLASIRFPCKVMFKFFGLEMVEHVRRRALMARNLDRVIVATSDTEIADMIKGYGGDVVLTSNHHQNGTSRVAEAALHLECSHVVLLQGDEPLLLPDHVDALAQAIINTPNADAWNVTAPIQNAEELDRHSFVKCAVGYDDRILYCFRRSPSHTELQIQQGYIRKILGLFAFRKSVLLNISDMPTSVVETAESIEQMRLIENGRYMISVPVETALPSVNEPHEADIVEDYVCHSPIQKALLDKVLGQVG